MTFTTARVLRIFLGDSAGDHYGFEISKDSRLPSGTIYPILARLEREGWITGHWEDIDEKTEGRRRRRYYRLTGIGQRAGLAALEDTRKLLFPELAQGEAV